MMTEMRSSSEVKHLVFCKRLMPNNLGKRTLQTSAAISVHCHRHVSICFFISFMLLFQEDHAGFLEPGN